MINFEEYMVDVKSQLFERATDEYKNEYITYYYSEEMVDSNLDYFKDCFNNRLSAYKALLFFDDFLNGGYLFN